MIREAIGALVEGRSLTSDEAGGAMSEIMDGEATPAQIAAFVTALRIKVETLDEIVGMARVMREKSLRVDVDGPLVDTCGTGGDSSGTFNISTTVGFVAAGAGARVAKHGNRAASGATGSADVLEELGANIALGPDGVKRCIEEVGFGFMFAQTFHPAMRFAAVAAARDRHQDDLQHPRAAHEPGGIYRQGLRHGRPRPRARRSPVSRDAGLRSRADRPRP